jgi:hypothetical protein
MKVEGNGGILTVRSFIICNHLQISLGRPNQEERCGWDMWHAWKRGEKSTGFWWKSLKERDHSEDRGVDGRMWNVFILLRIGTGGRLL